MTREITIPDKLFPAIRFWAGWVVMLALLMVASVPLGFMPDREQDGQVKLTICSGAGEKTILVDINGNDADNIPHRVPVKQPICAVLGTLAQGQIEVPTGIVLVSAPMLMALRLETMLRDSIVRDIHYAPYIARGPPQMTV